MRDAGDLLPITKEGGPIVVRPPNLQDLAYSGGMARDLCEKAIGAHRFPSTRASAAASRLLGPRQDRRWQRSHVVARADYAERNVLASWLTPARNGSLGIR